MQPLIIDLSQKKIIIVGGGKIAARKAKVMREEGAIITFIAPEFSEEVHELSKQMDYTLIKRAPRPEDFSEVILVILATNNRTVNHNLVKSLPVNQLVCVVDESGEGNVTFPATVRRGHLQIAVTSNGASPKLTRKLKKELEMQFDESWVEYTAWLSVMREKVKRMDISFQEKQNILLEVLEEKYKNDQLLRSRFSE